MWSVNLALNQFKERVELMFSQPPLLALESAQSARVFEQLWLPSEPATWSCQHLGDFVLLDQ